MSGWWTIISTETPEQMADMTKVNKEAFLATWEAGLSGAGWIAQLCEQGKATQLTFNGFPNRYTAPASVIAPLLLAGIAEAQDGEFPQDQLTGWPGSITVHAERIAACAPGQLLTVEVWDQS
ncbi:hypothetical protein SAMN05880566_108142 [Janthinobacterium sp. TND4EL3]|uniref:hypothetical protein n=1 Tax=Janthinobacterium sp. TND4EL3 TaxID=1907311 RepID=UPI000955501A|nr:hypothetical protein [Janthinobacterium sp. TND4EL3]SIR08806.1 hypothetical protein SAMN05880566_108142 [Janthinobacterium sp. TND4EL3]